MRNRKKLLHTALFSRAVILIIPWLFIAFIIFALYAKLVKIRHEKSSIFADTFSQVESFKGTGGSPAPYGQDFKYLSRSYFWVKFALNTTESAMTFMKGLFNVFIAKKLHFFLE